MNYPANVPSAHDLNEMLKKVVDLAKCDAPYPLKGMGFVSVK